MLTVLATIRGKLTSMERCASIKCVAEQADVSASTDTSG